MQVLLYCVFTDTDEEIDVITVKGDEKRPATLSTSEGSASLSTSQGSSSLFTSESQLVSDQPPTHFLIISGACGSTFEVNKNKKILDKSKRTTRKQETSKANVINYPEDIHNYCLKPAVKSRERDKPRMYKKNSKVPKDKDAKSSQIPAIIPEKDFTFYPWAKKNSLEQKRRRDQKLCFEKLRDCIPALMYTAEQTTKNICKQEILDGAINEIKDLRKDEYRLKRKLSHQKAKNHSLIQVKYHLFNNSKFTNQAS